MFYSTIFIAAAGLCGLASAQNYSTTGPISVVPDTVPLVLRQSWCRGETASCPQICGGQAFPNSCSADLLTYQCVCTDGSKPNISDYDATLPSFICAQWKIDCVKAHPNDLNGQTACLSVTCGSKNASDVAQSGPGSGGSQSSSSAPSMSSATGKSGGTKTGGGNAKASATNTGAAVAMNIGQSYGAGILATGLLAIFGLAL